MRESTDSHNESTDGRLHEQLLARLLTAAGSRPDVPSYAIARLEGAARAEWSRQVRSLRRRRTAVWAAASLAAAATVTLIVGLAVRAGTAPPAPTEALLATVQAVHGTVFVVREGAPETRLAAGERLTSDAELRTTGEGSAALALAPRLHLRLAPESRARLTSGGRVELAGGRVYVESDAPEAALEVVTPLGTVHHVGTAFQVEVAPGSLRVLVREGRVRLQRERSAHEVAAGEDLLLEPPAELSIRPVATSGPDWEWTLELAPPFEIEGRTLGEYLDWLAGETGWEIRGAGEPLPPEVTGIVLHGSIAGIRPDRTPELVLPSCRLSHRLVAGTLTVERPSGAGGGE